MFGRENILNKVAICEKNLFKENLLMEYECNEYTSTQGMWYGVSYPRRLVLVELGNVTRENNCHVNSDRDLQSFVREKGSVGLKIINQPKGRIEAFLKWKRKT